MPANSASGTSTSGSANQWRCGWPLASKLHSHARNCRNAGVEPLPGPAATLGRAGSPRRRLLAPPLCWSLPRAAPPRRAALPRLPPRAALPAARARGLAGVTAWAPVAYEGPAGELVRALKFRGAPRRRAARWPPQIAANAPAALLAGAALVPVPLHPGRRRPRGFNQAAALAARSAARTGLPVADCLERGRAASGRQVGRGRAARLRWTARARCGRDSGAPARGRCWSTTWSPPAPRSRRAPRALRAAGAAEVVRVAFARATGR